MIEERKISRDSYIFIDVTWKGGFKHTVPCRGYNLKSQLAFNDSLFWVESHHWYVVTEEQYQEKLWGSGSAADTEKTTSTSTTRSRSKSGQSEKGVGKKHSATKQSAPAVTKNTKKKVTSSTQTKKPRSGSSQKESNEHSNTKRVRKA